MLTGVFSRRNRAMVSRTQLRAAWVGDRRAKSAGVVYIADIYTAPRDVESPRAHTQNRLLRRDISHLFRVGRKKVLAHILTTTAS